VQEEQTSDLYRERSYSWRRLALGYGDFTQQSNGVPARYFYASNAWHSGAMRGLGPRFRPLALAATEGEVAGFAEAVHVEAGSPQTRLFALAGRYVRRWEGETGPEQALSLDLGAGVEVRSWTRWTAGGPGQEDALYLTDSGWRLWRYQHGEWTNLTATAGVSAAFVLATGPELWRVTATADQPAVAYAVSKCEADPAVPANWTSPIPVGDASVPVSGLSELQLRLFIHKQDATVWALQGGIDTGTARNLTPDLRESRDPENGKRPAAWLGALYFRAGDTLWRFTGTAAERIGPERLVDNTSPVRGPVVAFCGVGAWYGLGAVYNAALSTSYLVQYGNWVPGEETSPAGGAHQFVPAWDGSLCDLAGTPGAPKRVTALHVTTHQSVVGAPPDGGNPLLLVGFADGTYGWLRLPRDGPSPFTPDAHLAPEDFTDEPSFTRHPRHSLMAPGDIKAYLSFAAGGPVLDPSRWVEAEYRVDPVGREDAWQTLAGRLTQHGARALFPEDTTGRVIDVRERYRALRPPTPGPEQDDFDRIPTPVVATLTLREQVRPAFRLEVAMTLIAHEGTARRDGAADRKTPAQIRNLLVDAAQDPGHVTLTLPDETLSRFALIEYQEQVPPDGRFRRRGVAWDIGVTCVQYVTKSIYGIFDRLNATRFGDLGEGTFADLEAW
jgi:hypothetical protein